LLFWATYGYAGGRKEEALANSVKAIMQKTVNEAAPPKLVFASPEEGRAWLVEMSQRLQKRMPDKAYRVDFFTSDQYEATHAGLDPQLVLSLIQVESALKIYESLVSAPVATRR